MKKIAMLNVILMFLVITVFFSIATAGDITVKDADIPPGSTVYWTADNTYHLDGRVFVDDGAVLNIEAGTVIKGMPGDSIDASVLIVARGGKIFAEGTPDKPIIMTAESDDLDDPLNPSFDTQGLWGGLIMLGKAPINVAAGENNIEGIPTTEAQGVYGGTDPDDNSGVLRYVSIRHGGISIGEGNEINGLTMGGVGRGTTIEYIEVFANQDDGYEWFGGTVNCRHLIAAFCGDDCFDHDEGLTCKMQFLFAIQHEAFGNMCGEHDGAPSSDVAATPLAYPVIYNATFLGSGQNSSNPDQERIFRIRENWGGEYRNCIFGDYNGWGLDIEHKYSPTDSKERLTAGELRFTNNIWFNCNGYTMADSIGRDDYVQAYLQDAANKNVEVDPQLLGISRREDGGLDPRPKTGGPAWSDVASVPADDDFFTQVPYKGAFGQTNWAEGWTALTHYGILGNVETAIHTFETQAVPAQYRLSQNYPNPFNPTTKITYTLPEAGQVKLVVFNQLGQEVTTLVNTVSSAGVFDVTWDASTLPSGIYFYRLEAGRHVEVKKMMLLE